MSKFLKAALWYAQRGWRVHPVSPGGKLPIVRGWPRLATTDPDTIRRWWNETPTANVGLACGPDSGLLVLDIDDPGAAAGLPGPLPDGPAVQTGRGVHLYMRWPGSLGDAPTTKAALWPGVDVRGRGGSIVAPPSIHPRGCAYEWITPPNSPLPSPPNWLIERLTPPPLPPRREVAFAEPRGRSRYAAAALRREVERVAEALEGGRNHALNQAAYSLGTLSGAGLLDPVDVAEALSRAGLAAGLTRHETERTITSGLTAGLKNPREVHHV